MGKNSANRARGMILLWCLLMVYVMWIYHCAIVIKFVYLCEYIKIDDL
jgi:hypothetical protein